MSPQALHLTPADIPLQTQFLIFSPEHGLISEHGCEEEARHSFANYLSDFELGEVPAISAEALGRRMGDSRRLTVRNIQCISTAPAAARFRDLFSVWAVTGLRLPVLIQFVARPENATREQIQISILLHGHIVMSQGRAEHARFAILV